ncbi:ribbon-helix-helix domain-containing protein [Rhizobium sp. FKY42]|uniref:ribbon-helix-helix domain-containing protein n=1 Tax=Rhizobium sp. FKY42 TaxID=2562310 RepID=UPI001FED915A|nr:ribbon-helix-helix domain-containing protein [Rhizobium sp. FKY42]
MTIQGRQAPTEILRLQNRSMDALHVRMTNSTSDLSRKYVAAHRARLKAAGQVSVTTVLSAETVEQLDRLKEQRGVSSRAPLIEEAVRAYIENLRA